MTDLNLAELDSLEKEATEGPWFWNSYSDIWSKLLGDALEVLTDEELDAQEALSRAEQLKLEPIVCSVPNTGGDGTRGERQAADARFIEAARNQLRPLLDLVDKLATTTHLGQTIDCPPRCPRCSALTTWWKAKKLRRLF